jgi:UDP-N-acetylglucosamine:LPS N-acetylglucosamine transferase
MGAAPRRIDVVYFDAGSGHHSAARAIEHAVRRSQPDWCVRSVNVADVLAGHSAFQAISRLAINYVNDMIRHERVFHLKYLMRCCLWLCDRLSPRDFGRIGRFWLHSPPDELVSVTPMFNEVLYHSLRRANPNARYITVPVDLEEVFPRYWFTPSTDVRYLAGSEPLVRQARAAGVPDHSLTRLSGMVVDPAFYDSAPGIQPDRLQALGLDPGLPVGLVSFGGQGSIIMRRIARALAAGPRPLNVIFLCGRNHALAQQLRSMSLPYPRLVLDYLPETPVAYYRLAAFTIGKPGTMTIYESLVAGAPVLALESTGMAPLQRGNERWLAASGAGLVVGRVADLPRAVDRVLDGTGEFRAAARRHAARGVFEAAEAIVALLEPKRSREAKTAAADRTAG